MRSGFFCATGLALSLSLAVPAGGPVAAAEQLAPAIVLPAGLTEPAAPAQPVITPTADFPGEPVIAPPEPLGWTWAITPRAWFLWETDHYFQQGEFRFEDTFDLDIQISNKTTFIPFAGGTVSVTPGPGAPTYSLTALYGEGSAQNSALLGVRGPGEDVVVPYDGAVETKRLDIEAIAQIPAAEGVSGILGARFIRFDRNEGGELFFDQASFGVVDVDFDLVQHFYLGEAGFSINRPVNAEGSFVAFGNLIGMLGYADVVNHTSEQGVSGVFNLPESALEGGVFGVDTNAGLGYRLTPRIFASARYRLFYLTAPDFGFRTGGTFMHGPELNVTFSFGG